MLKILRIDHIESIEIISFRDCYTLNYYKPTFRTLERTRSTVTMRAVKSLKHWFCLKITNIRVFGSKISMYSRES